MSVPTSILKEVINEYKSFLLRKRIIEISLVNSRLFCFSFYKENKKLIVDLDNNNPYIGIINSTYNELSLPSDFIAKLMQKGKPIISNIEILNNDKIIRITSKSIDAYYHENIFYLYIELIQSHANIILCDKNNVIISAFYETSINAPRLIIRGAKYIYPSKKEYIEKELIYDKKEYQDFVNKSFENGIKKRKIEKYQTLIKNNRKLIASLERKLIKFNELKKEADESYKYQEYGNIILTNIDLIKKGDPSFEGIKLDISKSPYQNAEYYFHKYKKLKKSVEFINKFERDTINDLENAKYLQDVLNYGDEKDISLIFTPVKSKKKTENEKAYLPYLIKHNETIYYYGHNALENDYLVFKMFHKTSDVIWMHLKDQSSAHLIINKINPSMEELLIGCGILLLISKKDNGEIMYTSRNKVTRDNTKNKLALTNVLSYQTILIKKINPLCFELIKKEKRVRE